MYTFIRNGDGSVTFSTRRPVEEMDRRQARRVLSGLLPLLHQLVDAAYPEGPEGGSGVPDS